MPSDKEQIVVTGIGMVSSLGLDSATSCAAARAGFSGAGQLDFQLINPATNDPAPVVGHQIPFVRGFERFARLLRLAQLAWSDMRRSHLREQLDPQRCLLFVVMPPAGRSAEGILASKERPYDNCQLESPIEYPPSTEILRRFAALVAHGLLPDHQHLVVAEHAGFAQALQLAEQKFEAGSFTHAVIFAVDSLIESHTLQWLYDHARLKFGENPVGLIPGEAGCAVLIEPASRARSRKAVPLAIVQGVHIDNDEQHLFSEAPPVGLGLAKAVSALHASLPEGVNTPWVLSDHNGEVHRATDWGYALPRLVNEINSLRRPAMSYPAIAIGDTGAASGAVALCTAVRSYSRNYAPSRQALIVSSSDHGERGAIYLNQSA